MSEEYSFLQTRRAVIRLACLSISHQDRGAGRGRHTSVLSSSSNLGTHKLVSDSQLKPRNRDGLAGCVDGECRRGSCTPRVCRNKGCLSVPQGTRCGPCAIDSHVQAGLHTPPQPWAEITWMCCQEPRGSKNCSQESNALPCLQELQIGILSNEGVEAAKMP